MHSRYKAQCACTWHVYEDHRDIWLEQVGDRPPRDPDPRDPLFDMLYGGNLPQSTTVDYGRYRYSLERAERPLGLE
jgi:hypothetical protein